jgi:hypothetical protein
MNDQEIIDNAPAKQGKWPDCNQVDSDGKWSHRMPLIRSLADIKRIVELEKALDKLIDRAQQVDSWESFPDTWLNEAYEALKEPKS